MIKIISKGKTHNETSNDSLMGFLVFNSKHEIILCSSKVKFLLSQNEINQLINILADGEDFNHWNHYAADKGEIACFCEKVADSFCVNIYFVSEMEILAKASNAFIELEKEYQIVLDHIDDGIFVIDNKGYVIKLNEAARGSRSLKEYIGVNVKDDIVKGHISHSVADTIIKNSLTQKLHMIIKYPDRDDVLSTGTPYYENGNLKFIVACERNVENLELLKQQLVATLNEESLIKYSIESLRIEGLRNNKLVTNSEIMKKIDQSDKENRIL